MKNNFPVASILKNAYTLAFVLLSIWGIFSLYAMTNGGNVTDAAWLLLISFSGILIITFLLRKSLPRLLFLYSGISVVGLMAIGSAPETWFETAGVITTFGLTAASIITFIYTRQYQKRQKSRTNKADVPVKK